MDLTRLDPDAVRSVQRLESRGFEAYLVGGCVRDLLLDRDPKDFDIATEARPQQVKRAFPRNCRIIGRRFKLAHLHFDGNRKILEVATFRSSPVPEGEDSEESDGRSDDDPTEDRRHPEIPTQGHLFASTARDEEFPDDDFPDDDSSDDDSLDDDSLDDDTPEDDRDRDDRDDRDDPDDPDDGDGAVETDLLIVRDNEFGSVEEDALRRDFTINAMFLDPVTDEIIDYVGGLQDVEARIIRTIGDPETRFREDPVRILRAAKFAGRLRFHFDDATWRAMRATSADLARAAPPRVLEEILRLLRAGHALPSFQILRDVGGLAVLLPDVYGYLEAADAAERRVFWRLLDALDNHIHNGATPSSAVTLGCIFLRPILHRFDASASRSLTTAVEEIIGPLAQELRLPRRDAGALKRICSVQPRFTATGKRRFRLASFLHDPHFAEALELFELSCHAEAGGFEPLEHWRALCAEIRPEAEAEPDAPTARNGRDARPGRNREPQSSRRSNKRAARPRKAQRSERKEQRSERKESKPKPAQKSGRKKRDKADEILTIEPETYDLSAFDRELAPREVPQFDTIVESQPKRRQRPQLDENDSYKPPPPPGGDADAPPPSAPSSDVFGDW